jgi:hypothetical protein
MKKYSKLIVPKDSAWDNTRFKWGKYVNWRIRYFFQGVWNIIRWIPTLYKDKDWDDAYILMILQKKIEHQRAELVNANRHTNVDNDNFWMTIVLNLIERELHSYYSSEKYDYCKIENSFGEPDQYGSREWNMTIVEDHLDLYLDLYPSATRKILKKYRNEKYDSDQISLEVGWYNQTRCRNLIFEILKQKSANWWD